MDAKTSFGSSSNPHSDTRKWPDKIETTKNGEEKVSSAKKVSVLSSSWEDYNSNYSKDKELPPFKNFLDDKRAKNSSISPKIGNIEDFEGIEDLMRSNNNDPDLEWEIENHSKAKKLEEFRLRLSELGKDRTKAITENNKKKLSEINKAIKEINDEIKLLS